MRVHRLAISLLPACVCPPAAAAQDARRAAGERGGVDGTGGQCRGEVRLPPGALPLRPGYIPRLAVYDVETGIDTVVIEMERIEGVRLPEGGRVAAVRVR